MLKNIWYYHMISSYIHLKWIEFTKNCGICSNLVRVHRDLQLEENFSFIFGPLQVKWFCHMFSNLKQEEYMESELLGTFGVKVVSKNILLGSLRCLFLMSLFDVSFWRSKQIFWAKLLHLSVFLLNSTLVWFMWKKSHFV